MENNVPKFTATTVYRPPLVLMNKNDTETIVPESDFALLLVNLDPKKDTKSFMNDLSMDDIGKFEMPIEFGSSYRPDLQIYTVGFPGANTFKKTLTTGKSITDLEAETLLKNSQSKTSIPPYKKDEEFLALGYYTSGFSGGPALDSDGKLVGVVVRAGTANGKFYARFVRIEYILQKLAEAKFELFLQSLLKPIIDAAKF